MDKLTVWFLLFVMFSLIDLKLTDHFLSHTCIQEQNPVAQVLYKEYGLPGLFLLKVTAIALFFVCCNRIAEKKPHLAKKTIIYSTILMIFVVVYTSYALLTVSHVVPTVYKATRPQSQL